MIVSLSDLKVNVGRYVDLAETEDVVITKYGKPVAKIICIDKTPQRTKKIPPKITSISLYAVHNGRRFFCFAV